MHTLTHTPVLARWALLATFAAVAAWSAAVVAQTGLLSVPIVALLVLPAAAVFILMCAGIAPSHKRSVAVVALLGPVALVMQYGAVPNVGLPFGYWAHPNRAIDAFLKCPNVQSARLGFWHEDVGLEDFEIVVTFVDLNGSTITQQVQFPKHSSQERIRDLVATTGCQL